jgi:AraC-like DNA-binding protein
MSADERAEEMRNLYANERLTYSEIGERFGLSRQRVQQILAPFDLEPHGGSRKRIQQDERLRLAFARIEAGESTTVEEALKLGYKTQHTLRGAFHRLGLHRSEKPLPEHGTYARYASKKDPCRCDLCMEAGREQRNKRRGREPPEHGTNASYRNYGCHCDLCRAAARKYEKELRDRKKKEEAAA